MINKNLNLITKGFIVLVIIVFFSYCFIPLYTLQHSENINGILYAQTTSSSSSSSGFLSSSGCFCSSGLNGIPKCTGCNGVVLCADHNKSPTCSRIGGTPLCCDNGGSGTNCSPAGDFVVFVCASSSSSSGFISPTSSSSSSGCSCINGTVMCPNCNIVGCADTDKVPTCARGFGFPLCCNNGGAGTACNSNFVCTNELQPSSSSSSSSSSGCICVNGVITCENCTPECSDSSVMLECRAGVPLCCTSSGSAGTTCNSNIICRPQAPDTRNLVLCLNSEVICTRDKPTCAGGNIAVCGSVFGLKGEFEGVGCTNEQKAFFSLGGVTCTQGFFVPTLSRPVCKTKNLCPKKQKSSISCREDISICKCVCPFPRKQGGRRPRCNKNNELTCGKTNAVCSDSKNIPICNSRKPICKNKDTGTIDLIDRVKCN